MNFACDFNWNDFSSVLSEGFLTPSNNDLLCSCSMECEGHKPPCRVDSVQFCIARGCKPVGGLFRLEIWRSVIF
jgi:hypothetical protein